MSDINFRDIFALILVVLLAWMVLSLNEACAHEGGGKLPYADVEIVLGFEPGDTLETYTPKQCKYACQRELARAHCPPLPVERNGEPLVATFSQAANNPRCPFLSVEPH